MGFYRRHVLPRVMDLAMRTEESARLRAIWIPRARGDVLEVGIGSGLNLPFYSPEVRHVYGVDSSAELLQMTRQRTSAASVKVELLSQSVEERLPLTAGSIDTVVITWSLCSIPNVRQALGQIKRVLKGTGRLIFVEHGRAPDAEVVAWQDRLTPLWKHATGGCHLNRKIDEIITTEGFEILELQTCYLRGPRPMTYTYQGVAQPAAQDSV